jgi:hypothetical protein
MMAGVGYQPPSGTPLRLGLRDRGEHPFTSRVIDQGSDQCFGITRIADTQLGIHLEESVHQRVVHAVMNHQTSQAGAALPGRTHRRKHDRPHGEIQIGTRGHDHRVIAAQLQN